MNDGRFITSLQLEKNLDILEVGCGSGDLLRFLKKNGHRGKLFGIAKLTESINEGNLKIEKGLAEALPFEDNSLDVILVMGALSFFDDVPRSITETHRVLKPNGLAIYQCLDETSLPIQNMMSQIVEKHSGYPIPIGFYRGTSQILLKHIHGLFSISKIISEEGSTSYTRKSMQKMFPLYEKLLIKRHNCEPRAIHAAWEEIQETVLPKDESAILDNYKSDYIILEKQTKLTSF